LADFYIAVALMAQSCNVFSLFICHVLASNLGIPVLTTQWRQKHRLAEKSKKKYAHDAAFNLHRTERLRLNKKNKGPAGFSPAKP
jgi:hypothetical protein